MKKYLSFIQPNHITNFFSSYHKHSSFNVKGSTITSSGFTIVELLIVIVVVGILATIVIVAYNGIQQRAQVASIVSEVKAWQKLLQAYKATNGYYPDPSPGSDPLTSGGPGANVQSYYCLGTGFPQTGGAGYCFLAQPGSIYSVAESKGAALMTALSSIGTPPSGSKKYTFGSVVGPWYIYSNSNTVRIGSTFPPGTNCPSIGMTTNYGSSSRQDCTLLLN